LERWKQEDIKMKATVGEVGNLADEVSTLIRAREDKLKIIDLEKKQQLKTEAKEFSKNMGKMLRIKQELLSELEKAKKEEKRIEEERQKAKDREEVDEIAKMLRDLKNKEK
jgi:dGTP triphosphohydrolase